MKKINFNDDWQFYDYQLNEHKKICVPHDATIFTDRDSNIRNGWLCGYFYGGKYYYEKKIFIPEEYKSKTVFIEFEGIYSNSKIFVNEQEAYNIANGYIKLDFCLDIFLKYGTENTIRVEIDTPKTDHSRWYSGCGIHRDVNLYVGHKKHIALNGTKVTTLSYQPARIKIDSEIIGEIEESNVLIEIYDGDEKVAESSGKNTELEIQNVKLWQEDTPHLYVAKIALIDNGEIIDRNCVKFGIRLIEASAETGLLINGKETKLRGGCIHNDNGVLGMITTDATEERRIKNIKKAGFNAIRSAHHPASRALLDACDKYGIYVVDEAFDSWYRMKTRNDFSSVFFDEYLKVINAMVDNDYNHPSVVMYSIGNEIPETGSLKGKKYAVELINEIKKNDKTRLITICPSMRLAKDFIFDTPYAEISEDDYLITEERKKADFEHYVKVWTRGLYNLLDVFEYSKERSEQDERVMKGLYEHLDIAGFNYYGEYYENIHEKHPDWVICGTETEGNKLQFHMELMQKHKYVIGDFVWTLQDHLGEVNCCDMSFSQESGDKNYPWLVNYAGVLDLIGNPYFSLHKYQIIWGFKQGIFVGAQPPIFGGLEPKFNNDRETNAIESWSFEGCEGEKTFIDVITDADQAEVFVNGLSLGKRKVKNFTARFPATYIPGEVSAVGYDLHGNEIYRNQLKTAGEEAFLKINMDKDVLIGANDFCFINIDITDKDGNIKSFPERKVKVEVEGNGELAGYGSAAYKNIEKFNQNEHTTNYGRLLAVVRGKNLGKDEDIKIKISSEGLQSKEIVIKNINV